MEGLVVKILNIEIELVKFSRSIPFGYTDNMSMVDFFDYAEIIQIGLNRGQESGESDLEGSVESAISRGLPAGVNPGDIPGLENLGANIPRTAF